MQTAIVNPDASLSSGFPDQKKLHWMPEYGIRDVTSIFMRQ